VQVAGLSPATREALFDAIVRLERFPDRLAQILSTGVLRIGTTGDYQPFSLQADEGGPFSGIDIDLGRDLAAALGVTPQFVKTSWPTLLDDLAAGSYDIAMSGVSRTLARQRRGFLSRAYYVGGKTPVARCADAAGLNALAAIDRPGVRVIVNPGGTNQSFADANIHRAEVILHKDNRTIFQQLLDGNADVMITDRIEVELQAALHPELCATMAGDLTYQEKAFLMPQDPTWQAFVATWLDLRLADGTVAAAFAAHGVTPAPD
jgi:cyclohexadienyl dehydratase